MDKIRAIECINTWQGEGPDSGKRMLLIRFKHCDRNCVFCDTKVKMRASIESLYSINQIQETMNNQRLGLLITGGEPTIHYHFEETLSLLNNLNYSVANVESNGFSLLDLINEVESSKNVHYMYSPKIFNDKDYNDAIRRTEKLSSNKNVFIKVVYQNNELVNAYLNEIAKLNINERIYLMPEGVTRDAIIANSPEVFDMCEKYKINFSSRSHIIYSFI